MAPAGIDTKPFGLREKSRAKVEDVRPSIQAATIILLNIGKIPPARYN
jgi:hypothetical protein